MIRTSEQQGKPPTPITVADAIYIRGWRIRATCPQCDLTDIYTVGDDLDAIHALRCECGETICVMPRRPEMIGAAGGGCQ